MTTQMRYQTIAIGMIAVLMPGMIAAPTSASLHRLRVEAYVDEGATVVGSATYEGSVVRNAKVEVFAPDGKSLLTTKTDDSGEFRIETECRCDLNIVVTDGGHRGVAEIPAEDLPDDLPPC